jgi:putative Mg2+ transporter-C (MgtC) family protein
MLSTHEIILRLALGTLLGGIIGFERQSHGRAAGFRTQLLVCVACVLIMIISEGYYLQTAMNPQYMRIDPTRIAAGAMTGVGFLGAGVILKSGLSVQGLTTAACIWIVSAIGLAVGAGQYVAAVAGFVITFVSLWLLRILESQMPRLTYRYITLVTDETGDEAAVTHPFEEKGFRIVKMDYEVALREKERTFKFTVTTKHDAPIKEIIREVSGLNSVKRLEIRS